MIWKVIIICLISSIYAAEISFSSTWCVGTMPFSFTRYKARRQAKIISSSLLFFMGLIQVELPSITFRIIWYLFPLLYRWGKFPVWSVHMVTLGSYILMKTLRFSLLGEDQYLDVGICCSALPGVYFACGPSGSTLILGIACSHFYHEQWPVEIVSVLDALKPRQFGGEPCGRMEVSYCARQAW